MLQLNSRHQLSRRHFMCGSDTRWRRSTPHSRSPRRLNGCPWSATSRH